MASILILVLALFAFVAATTGLAEVTFNASLHHNTSNDPNNWLSGPERHRRQQHFRELLAPAVIAFAASAACNVGTSLLVEQRAQGLALLYSSGAFWLLGGVMTLLVALVVLIVTPAKTAWDLVESYEALYLHVRDEQGPATPAFARNVSERLDQVAESGTRHTCRLILAASLLPLPETAIDAQPVARLGALRDSGGIRYPASWRSVWIWTWKQRRLAGLQSVLAVLGLGCLGTAVIASAPLEGRSLISASVLAVTLAVGLIGNVFGMRLELTWYARLAARSASARARVLTELKVITDAIASPASPRKRKHERLLFAIGSVRITQLRGGRT
ncbi:hypothetical protein [Pedococcus sp. 2YAF34]|uniref:hypothetical protein n=1 Tax=Pedococcus sp. 2YAF34 TaxID=3233032 RepID=UPI003F9CCEE1